MATTPKPFMWKSDPYSGGGSSYLATELYTCPTGKNVKIQFTSWSHVNFTNGQYHQAFSVGSYIVDVDGNELLHDSMGHVAGTAYFQQTWFPVDKSDYPAGTSRSRAFVHRQNSADDVFPSNTNSAFGFNNTEFYMTAGEKFKVYHRQSANYPYQCIWRGLIIEEDISS